METYTIIYHANGGVGEDYVVSKVTYGENVLATLAETKITPKENKQFVGWAISENGKAIKEIIIKIEGNKELYALWKNVEIEPEPEPVTEPKNLGINTGVIIGIIVGCVTIVVGFSIYCLVIRKRKKTKQMDMDMDIGLTS